MKQYTVEISSSEIVRKKHLLIVLADNWRAALPKAIQQVRERTSSDVVIGDPKKLREESVEIEEMVMPTSSDS